jgi:hypothetical protein
MKTIKSFRKPETDYSDPNINPNDDLYYSTYRNGFVSALAMAYNFHLPL